MDFSLARTNMVKSQLTPNGVSDVALLDAMLALPREPFVVATHREFAYSDHALPIHAGRRSLKPLQIGRLMQALEVTAGQKILVVGAGCGYEAALLARLGAEVFALEKEESLVEQGRGLTQAATVRWLCGPLESGWSGEAPFDGLLLCGSVDAIPETLFAQLKEQGRLVAIVGAADSPVMHALRIQGSRERTTTTLFETTAFALLTSDSAQTFVL
ncbi:MAG: protein-L-isoaspartate O-methyltransferase [Magnetococcales bacterium]|nr:protein-L-isoaspartate O-methyltransferase [Magnetococcales bacterium]